MRDKIFEDIKNYTKDEILEGLKKTMFRLLRELPIIRYNSMCDKAQKLSEKAYDVLSAEDFKSYIKLSKESNKIWDEANNFITKHHALHVKE